MSSYKLSGSFDGNDNSVLSVTCNVIATSTYMDNGGAINDCSDGWTDLNGPQHGGFPVMPHMDCRSMYPTQSTCPDAAAGVPVLTSDDDVMPHMWKNSVERFSPICFEDIHHDYKPLEDFRQWASHEPGLEPSKTFSSQTLRHTPTYLHNNTGSYFSHDVGDCFPECTNEMFRDQGWDRETNMHPNIFGAEKITPNQCHPIGHTDGKQRGIQRFSSVEPNHGMISNRGDKRQTVELDTIRSSDNSFSQEIASYPQNMDDTFEVSDRNINGTAVVSCRYPSVHGEHQNQLATRITCKYSAPSLFPPGGNTSEYEQEQTIEYCKFVPQMYSLDSSSTSTSSGNDETDFYIFTQKSSTDDNRNTQGSAKMVTAVAKPVSIKTDQSPPKSPGSDTNLHAEETVVDVDHMISSGVTVAGYRPRNIIRKRAKHDVLRNMKDPSYWEKRRKNNESARRSREMKKLKEKGFYRRALELEYENVFLKERVEALQAKLSSCPASNSSPLCSEFS